MGVGNLDVGSSEALEEAASRWYEGVGALAKQNGVTVSVISLKGDECSLEQLGTVAEATGMKSK